MNFKEYQEKAWTTAIHPNAGNNYLYPVLGLVGEAGEVANKIKKVQRDGNGIVTEELRSAISAEIGDVLWYLACLSTELKLDLATVAEENIAKLALRKERGTLHGGGDVR